MERTWANRIGEEAAHAIGEATALMLAERGAKVVLGATGCVDLAVITGQPPVYERTP